MAFVERVIDLTFTLGQGTFGDSGSSTVKLEGLRVECTITKAGGPSMGRATLKVYGMTLSQMNQISTLGMRINLYRRNSVTVEVGENETAPIFRQPGGAASSPDQTPQAKRTTVFVGTITDAYADFNSIPQVPFIVEAHTGLIDTVIACPPTSIKGQASVASMISSLATRMSRRFENAGVTAQIANPYFEGSALEQVRAICKAAPCEFDDSGTAIVIWMAGKSRGGTAPLISSKTGLVGYPGYTSKGIQFKCLYNPSIGFGGQIVMQSTLTPANGTWVVYKLDYELAAQVPDGPWFANVEACRPGQVVVA